MLNLTLLLLLMLCRQLLEYLLLLSVAGADVVVAGPPAVVGSLSSITAAFLRPRSPLGWFCRYVCCPSKGTE